MTRVQRTKTKPDAKAAAERIQRLQEEAAQRLPSDLKRAAAAQNRYRFEDCEDSFLPAVEVKRRCIRQLILWEETGGGPSRELDRYCEMLVFAEASVQFMAEFAANVAAKQPRTAAKALRPAARDPMRAAIVEALRVRRVERGMALKQAMSDLEKGQSGDVQLEPVRNAPTVLVRWRGETRSVKLKSFDTYWRDARK